MWSLVGPFHLFYCEPVFHLRAYTWKSIHHILPRSKANLLPECGILLWSVMNTESLVWPYLLMCRMTLETNNDTHVLQRDNNDRWWWQWYISGLSCKRLDQTMFVPWSHSRWLKKIRKNEFVIIHYHQRITISYLKIENKNNFVFLINLIWSHLFRF